MNHWFKVYICNFVINEFNPTFEVQNMGLFKMPRFKTPRFQMGKRFTVASGPSDVDVNSWKVKFGLSLMLNFRSRQI